MDVEKKSYSTMTLLLQTNSVFEGLSSQGTLLKSVTFLGWEDDKNVVAAAKYSAAHPDL